MNKVVSLALFGHGDAYAQYLPSYLRAHLNLFPIDEGWDLVVHLAPDVDDRWQTYLRELQRQGLVELTMMPVEQLTRAMLWRLAPVFSESAGYVFCRDLDALPMPRDRKVCDDFMISGCDVGTAHDNQYHVGLMGGLCHFRAQSFRSVMGWKTLRDVFDAADSQTKSEWTKKGTDQDVLNRLVSAHTQIKLLEHRFGGWTNGKPTGKPRDGGYYGCEAYSVVIPDRGTSKLTLEFTERADELANHLGAAGYDHKAAQQFWDEHGDRGIRDWLREIERKVF